MPYCSAAAPQRQGFSVDNTLENPFGQLNSSDIGVSGETVSATLIGAAGFGFGVEFPRLELSILNTATAFITVKTYSYSIFTLEPPCQKGGTDLFAVAGYNLKVLGSTIASGNKTLWTKSLLKFKDDKPC